MEQHTHTSNFKVHNPWPTIIVAILTNTIPARYIIDLISSIITNITWVSISNFTTFQWDYSLSRVCMSYMYQKIPQWQYPCM